MNPLNPHSKLQHFSQEQTLSEQQVQAQQQQQILEFATAEEMIRYDAAQTPVPASVTERLQRSVGPVPPRSWWRRWLGQAG